MYSTMKNQILCKGFLSILLILISMSSLAADFTVPLSSLNTQFTIVLGPVSSPYTMWQLEQSYESNAGPWVSLGKKPIGNTSVTVTQFGKYFYRARQYNPAYGTWGSTQPIEIYDSWIVRGPVIVGTSALGTPQLFQSSDGATSFDGVYSLKWSAPPSGSPAVTYYQWKEGNGGWNNVGTALSSIQITKANGSYTYSVQACNATGCGASASYTVKVDLNIIPTITPSTLNSTDGKYNIGWTSGRANGKAFTHVWVYENNNPTWVYGTTHDGRATINQNPLVLNKTVQGINKYYVLACHGITFGSTGGVTPMPNTGTCIKSTEKSITTILGSVEEPNIFRYSAGATDDDRRTISLLWKSYPGVTRYELQRNDKTVVETFAGGAERMYYHDDTNVEIGKTYSYKLRACVANECSAWVIGSPCDVPPLNIDALYSVYSTDKIMLNWSSIKGANNYVVERDGLAIYTGNQVTIEDSVLDPKALYRVKACNNSICSGWAYDKYRADSIFSSGGGLVESEGYVHLVQGEVRNWYINRSEESTVKLLFYYRMTLDQSPEIIINEIKLDDVKFPLTANDGSWGETSIYVNLKKGENKISVTARTRIRIYYIKINLDTSSQDISQVWNKVAAALKTNNRAELTKYFDPAVMQNYNQVFDALGTNIIQVGNQLGSIEPMYVSETTAEYILTKKGDDGNNYVHIIKFIKDAQGNWKVNSL